MFGALVTLPLYLQIVKGSQPRGAGLMLLTLTLAMLSSSVVSAQVVARTGRYKVLPVVGSALLVASLGLLGTVDADTPLGPTGCYMAVFGFGLGLCTQPLVIAVQNSLPPQHLGMATGSVTFFRQIGGTIGVAVFLSVLFSGVRGRIDGFSGVPGFTEAVGDPAVRADPANAPVLRVLDHGRLSDVPLDDSSFIGHLDARLAEPFRLGFAESMSGVFLTAMAVLVVGFVLALLLKELPLADRSALAARAEQAGVES